MTTFEIFFNLSGDILFILKARQNPSSRLHAVVAEHDQQNDGTHHSDNQQGERSGTHARAAFRVTAVVVDHLEEILAGGPDPRGDLHDKLHVRRKQLKWMDAEKMTVQES